MTITSLPADVLSLCFNRLPLKDLQSVFQVCQSWKRIADSDRTWKTWAERLPIPEKICDRHFQYYPQWIIFSEPGREKEKVRQFLLSSRKVYLYVSPEKLKYHDRPFSYRQPSGGGANFYPDYLGPESFETFGLHLSYPWGPRNHCVISICVHDEQGKPIPYFPNSVQYFYLLNKKEGDMLYWIYNGVFYRIACLQQSLHSSMTEQSFERFIADKVNEFIERGELLQDNIHAKQEDIKGLFALASFQKFDTRWLLIQ